MAGRLKLAGRRFGRLAVVRGAERASRSGHRHWWARCDCGHEVMVLGSELARGRSQSCGCLRFECAAAIGFIAARMNRRGDDGRYVAVAP